MSLSRFLPWVSKPTMPKKAMRASILLVFCWLSGVIVTAALMPPQRGAFAPMAVTYPSALTADRERADADFEAIQTLGFNAVRVTDRLGER